MKKIFVLLLLGFIAIISLGNNNTYAYAPLSDNTNEYKGYSNGMTIIANASSDLITGAYQFTVTFNTPHSAHYVMFGDFRDINIFPSRYPQASYDLDYMITNNAIKSCSLKDWHIYLGSRTGTSKTMYFHVIAGTGAAAQFLLQGYIDNSFYIYYDIVNTSSNTVTEAFLARYSDLDVTTAYDLGHSTGYNEARFDLYLPFYNEGYDQGMDDMYLNGSDYYGYDHSNSYDYDDGLSDGASAQEVNLVDLGYLMTGFFRTFDILGIKILGPNITIGMIIAVPLVLGLMSFIVGVATFAITTSTRSNLRSNSGKPSRGKKK